MPLYQYRCQHCDHEFEKRQSFNDEPVTICPICAHESVKRVISNVGIVFKGSGFYVTDNRTQNGRASKASKNAPKDKKSDSKKSEPVAAAAD